MPSARLGRLERQGHMRYETPAVVKRQKVVGLLGRTISETAEDID